MNQNERREYMIKALLDERGEYEEDTVLPVDELGQKRMLRALMNVRMPGTIDSGFLDIQNDYLQIENSNRQIVDAANLPEIKSGISVWQGSITELKCDAIVNAANSGMTGCYTPNHTCIDNCIHTYAGVQLRLECAEIISKQGHEEVTGSAKITKGYNLPCRYVLHTVGPIIMGAVTKRDEELLASCYRSCLELAADNELESIAFCCISTGVFHFPNRRAAEIAVDTVDEFMKKNTSIKKVIFNVFKDDDRKIYEELLR